MQVECGLRGYILQLLLALLPPGGQMAELHLLTLYFIPSQALQRMSPKGQSTKSYW